MATETVNVTFEIPVGNTLFVDAVNGDDGTALPDRFDLPYLTPAAAVAAASSGDLVWVWPGAYTVTTNLAKNGVNWHLCEGVTFTFNGAGTTSLFDDGGAAMTFKVGGLGNIYSDTTDPNADGYLIDISNSGSNFNFDCLDLVSVGAIVTSGFTDPIHQDGGTLTINCRDILVQGDAHAYGIWWTDGPMSIRARNVIATATGGVALCSYVSADMPTGEAYLFADLIDASQSTGDCIAQGTLPTPTAGSTARVWITASQIKGSDVDVVSTIGKGDGGNLYVTAQKVSGMIYDYGANGTLYLNTQKHQFNDGAGLDQLHLEGFKSYVNIGELVSGTAVDDIVATVSDGTHFLNIVNYTRSTDGNGIELSGGTLHFTGRIDTSIDATASPIVVSGGTLELDNAELIAEATADSIASATPRTVSAVASRVFQAVGADITVTGDLFYDDGTETAGNVATKNADGTWSWAAGGAGSGDVVGPASATDNAIARYDTTTGKLIQNSGITIADGATGTLSGTNTGDQDLSPYQTIAALAADVRAVVLTGLSLASSAAVAATDTILVAFGKLQAFNNLFTTVGLAIARLTNPGAVTFLRMNADNTATARTASEMRTDLGLGTLATQSGTFSGTSSGTNTGDQTSVTGSAGSLSTQVITRITSDFTTTSTTLVDVTGGTAAMEANKDYVVEVALLIQSSNINAGTWVSLNGPASPTSVAFTYSVPTGATSQENRFNNAYDGGSASSATGVANTTYFGWIRGIVRNGANAGNLQLRLAAETAVTVRIMTGTVITLTKTN